MGLKNLKINADQIFSFERDFIEDSYNKFCSSYQYQSYDSAIPFILDLDKLVAGGVPDKFSIDVFGCHGVEINKPGYSNKFSVAEAVRQSKSNMVVTLGDNVYPVGLGPIDSDNQKNLLDLEEAGFLQDSAGYLSRGKPHFMSLGNHDYNVHHGVNQIRHNSPSFFRGARQISATYKSRFFNMFPVHMPYRFYALVKTLPNNSAVIIYCIDSNTLLWDAYQQDWLVKTYQALNQKFRNHVWNIVAQHNPVFSRGKRGDPSSFSYDDIGMYEGLLRVHGVEPRRLKTISMASELSDYYYNLELQDGLKFDAFLGAHDHHTSIVKVAYPTAINKGDKLLIVAGAGGGKLQSFYPISNQHLNWENFRSLYDNDKEYGFCKMTFSYNAGQGQSALAVMPIGSDGTERRSDPIVLVKNVEGVAQLVP